MIKYFLGTLYSARNSDIFMLCLQSLSYITLMFLCLQLELCFSPNRNEELNTNGFDCMWLATLASVTLMTNTTAPDNHYGPLSVCRPVFKNTSGSPWHWWMIFRKTVLLSGWNISQNGTVRLRHTQQREIRGNYRQTVRENILKKLPL